MTKSLAFPIVALLATAACTNMNGSDGAMGQMSRSSAADMAMDMTPTSAEPFVRMASAGDLYETQSSNLALTKSQNAQVRQFAQTMITDHAKTTATLMTQARAAGLTPPTPTLTPMQRDDIARLRGLSGAAFDREYLSQQGMSHRMALSLNQTYAAGGDTPALRTAATAAVPIIQSHIDMLGRITGAM